MKLGLLVAVVLLMLGGAVGGSYVLSLWAINRSQHQWCDTLTVITANAHPQTESSKEFYAKLHALERTFGC